MPTKKTGPKRPCVSIRGATFDKLRELAEAKGRTVSALLEEQLERFFREQGLMPPRPPH